MSKFATLINFISEKNKKTGPCGSVQIGASKQETWASCKCAKCPLLPNKSYWEKGIKKWMIGNFIAKSQRKEGGKTNRISNAFGSFLSCYAHSGTQSMAANTLNKAFAEIKPGVTKVEDLEYMSGDYEVDIVAFRRMYTGESQRGRSPGWENAIVQGGDIIAAPGQGKFAYVLRNDETEPPAEIQKIWSEYLKIEKIFAETIKSGLTSREIIQNYKKKNISII